MVYRSVTIAALLLLTSTTYLHLNGNPSNPVIEGKNIYNYIYAYIERATYPHHNTFETWKLKIDSCAQVTNSYRLSVLLGLCFNQLTKEAIDRDLSNKLASHIATKFFNKIEFITDDRTTAKLVAEDMKEEVTTALTNSPLDPRHKLDYSFEHSNDKTMLNCTNKDSEFPKIGAITPFMGKNMIRKAKPSLLKHRYHQLTMIQNCPEFLKEHRDRSDAQ